jgi:hypothetical protein
MSEDNTRVPLNVKAANVLKVIWDKVTLNGARLERGMEKASLGGAVIGPVAMAGYFTGPIYREDGLGGLAKMALTVLAFLIAELAIKSRAEISLFDKKKTEDYTKDAVAFYEANKGKGLAPK